MQHDAVQALIAYHDRTKHHLERYARGPGGLDWETQPDPFRRYAGSPLFPLPLAGRDDTPAAGVLFGTEVPVPRPLTQESLGLFFELSLGLSARKEIGGTGWYLRMNPSSGNLHPTEAYAVLPALAGWAGGAGVYHYAPLAHALEQRTLRAGFDESDKSGFWVALTSIPWRESWKYGERGFRYCQHDVGHALAALRFAAAALGWGIRLETGLGVAELAKVLGLDREEDFRDAEREIPELLARVAVMDTPGSALSIPRGAPLEWQGRANRLSASQVPWPLIEEAIAHSGRGAPPDPEPQEPGDTAAWALPAPPQSNHSAGQIIRQRRSAVDFDGVTAVSRETFLAILDTSLARPDAPPFDAWPFSPRLHLVVFVHRVTGLDPGLYLWLRAPPDREALRTAFHAGFDWEPEASRDGPLFRLGRGDLRDFARTVSCHQEIAADGAFSLGMLARFHPVLRERGAAAYRELFWEAGMIGQALYLAAEAAGVRATGIGCYFDDLLHRALGLAGHDWQSLYHFTIGGPTDDPRLRTSNPYARPVPGGR